MLGCFYCKVTIRKHRYQEALRMIMEKKKADYNF